MKEVRHIEIVTNRLVNETMSGQYHSVFKGQGMVFQEVREYAPGDDVRRIDWNVTARTGKPHVKTFREERELTVLLMVDLSGSMYFGSGFGHTVPDSATEALKRSYAAKIAALLAFSAINNNDRVGLLLFTDTVEKFIPPRKGRNHVLRTVLELLSFQPRNHKTDLPSATEYAMKMLSHKSVVFLISDFMNPSRIKRPLSVLNQTHDLIALRVHDRHEYELPDVGEAVLEDPETGELITVNTSDKRVREAYARRITDTQNEMTTLFKQLRVDYVDLENGAPYLMPIVKIFKQRSSRY